jgi:hypothetical protein
MTALFALQHPIIDAIAAWFALNLYCVLLLARIGR